MNVDFIIVGQGLAGTLLAHELLESGKSVVVFNDPDQPKASDVAAGLINPVVFRRMTKNGLADEVFTQLEITYPRLERLLGKSFWFPVPIHRILGENEAAFWNEKRTVSQLEEFVGWAPEQGFGHPKVIAPYGYGEVKKAGRLDVPQLIHSFSEYLTRRERQRNEKFRVEELILRPGEVNYKDLKAAKVIFCKGQGATQNPFFKHLRFKSSKGEVLEIKLPGFDLNAILSHEVFLVPLCNDRYKIGATYCWDQLDNQTTAQGRNELLEKLKAMTRAIPEILEQKAGIRPTMHDRKPVIGLLPDCPQVGILNGLGPKGVLLGPYFARQFALFLTGKSLFIYPEANIRRYF